MIDLNQLNRYRMTDERVMRYCGNFGDGRAGLFMVPSPIDGVPMAVVASSDEGWDHVSVSRRNRIPNQTEMDHIFRLFFGEDETAVQFFVPVCEHVNFMPNCLHLWRPLDKRLPKPPRLFV